MPPKTETAQIETKKTEEYTHYTNIPLYENNRLTSVLRTLVEHSPNKQLAFDKFMKVSLFHKDYGYYTSNVDIGQERQRQFDFTTSPEALPSFGKYIGQSLKKVWGAMGTPSEFPIFEMGAGTGALAESLLEGAKEDPEFYKAIQYKIIEISPKLIPQQKGKLSKFNSELNPEKVTWIKGSAIDLKKLGIEDINGAFLSNELPDTFPVKLLTKINGENKEKYVTIKKDTSGNDVWGTVWGKPSPEVDKYLKKYNPNLKEKVTEPLSPEAAIWYENMSTALKTGVTLTFDYGRDGQVGRKDTPPIRNYGKKVPEVSEQDRLDTFRYPGEVDITADVNFEVFRKIDDENNLMTVLSETQKKFLSRYNIEDELKKLKDEFGFNSNEYRSAKIKASTENIHVLMSTKGIIGPIMNPSAEHLPVAEITPEDPKEIFKNFSESLNSPSLNESKATEMIEDLFETLESLSLEPSEIINYTIEELSSLPPDKGKLIKKIFNEKFQVRK
jgi:SAM-dependent MidA family methyltransferase